MGRVDTTLFIKHKDKYLLIVQFYIDDIIFSSTNELLCKEFSSFISKEFEMSMMGEFKYFLRLQIKSNKKGIFINQAKYLKDLLKRLGFEEVKPTIELDKDKKGKKVYVKTYQVMIGS